MKREELQGQTATHTYHRRQPRYQGVPKTNAPTLEDAFNNFIESHHEVRTFLHGNADLDLAGVRFSNPFIRGIRFSLATGLHVIPAHERRHLWQAWHVRKSAEQVWERKTADSNSPLSRVR